MVSKPKIIKYLNGIGTPFELSDIVGLKGLNKYHITMKGEIIALALVQENTILHFSVAKQRIGIGERLMQKIRLDLADKHSELLAFCPLFNTDYAYFLEDVGFVCTGEYLVDTQGFLFIFDIKPDSNKRPKPLINAPD